MNRTTNSLGLLVADSVTAMLAYWDRDLVCRYANAAYLEWFGKTKEEVVGKMTFKELLGAVYEDIEGYIVGAVSGSTQHFEIAMPCGNGEETRYSQVSLIPDFVEDEVRGFMVNAVDITPVMTLERKVQQSNNIIKSQNRSLLSFANIVSHDLKAYANNLEGLLTLYQEERDEESRAKIIDYLKNISAGFKSSVDNLSEIVAAQNLGSAPLEEVNLYECVAKAAEVLAPQINEANASVRIKVSPFIYVEANPAYMESIVYNFLSNAIKYRHPERSPIVELTTMVVGNETVLHIKDNGIGIDLEKHQSSLFGMYKTFHGNTDATGIGLFIAKYQVDSMGGHIGVESQVNKGTWFRIYFKTKAPAQASSLKILR